MIWRLAVLLWVMACTVRGQAANLTGQWATKAGGPYTLIENNDSRIGVIPGTKSNPLGYGWLERTGRGRLLKGELVVSGCWLQLSLEESEDGSTLFGSSRIIVKKSSRRCRSILTKDAKNGAANEFTLLRRIGR